MQKTKQRNVTGTAHGIVVGFYTTTQKFFGKGYLTEKAIKVLKHMPLDRKPIKKHPEALGIVQALVELGYVEPRRNVFYIITHYEKVKDYEGIGVEEFLRIMSR